MGRNLDYKEAVSHNKSNVCSILFSHNKAEIYNHLLNHSSEVIRKMITSKKIDIFFINILYFRVGHLFEKETIYEQTNIYYFVIFFYKYTIST